MKFFKEFLKDFVNNRKKTYKAIVFSHRSLTRQQMRRFNNQVCKIPPDTVEKV